ncbi:YobI family P-loop NTPase [Telluribacter humicola]|uniref:YobI family P-loop NTPase n=1 Tax=Telluribacter humicola TaxID=1720261 RepID=UPI001A961132|nr:hypothetical protein [Telluribacter humicola]
MKSKVASILTKLILKLQIVATKLTKDTEHHLPYKSLSPVDNADPNKTYTNALNWALRNRRKEDIKNIALTGPYGSGKSSILKTFEKNYKGDDLHFLHISLATFKEESLEDNISSRRVDTENNLDNFSSSKRKDKQLDDLRLLEISILQQIFYHEEDDKIPDSRFKKIKSYGKSKLYLISSLVVLFLISLLYLSNPSILLNFLNRLPFNGFWIPLIDLITRTIVIFVATLFIYKSIRTISSMNINKLKIHDTEIGFGDNLNKSILNHHIDEILYFFSIRPYNVVIIEDLDRFKQTEIFTKLREINFLLNGSEKTKHKHIVFIYAVRDEMFQDKDRTKFFDFIIPVIPTINSSNSSQILLSIRESLKYDLSDDIIENISLYIDDMRLLYNIMNEFYLYRQNLDPNLNSNKLLSILVYKNLYPKDFVDLSNNRGELYDVLNSKANYIKTIRIELEEKTSSLKSQIKDLEEVRIKDVKELRSLYILNTLNYVNNFTSFILNGEVIGNKELLEEDKFSYLLNDQIEYQQLVYYNNGYFKKESGKNGIKFKDIEALVSDKSYKTRKKEIDSININLSNALKIEISLIEQKLKDIRNLKYTEIIRLCESEGIIILGSDTNELINLLLRNGYIGEDYLDYISIFYEGSISSKDNQFLLYLRSQKRLDFSFKLNKIDKLIPKINPLDFGTIYILNYDLINYLMNSEGYTRELDLIFDTLKNESEISLEFIDSQESTLIETHKFFKLLFNKWHNVWNYVSSRLTITDQKKFQYFKYIIEFSDLNDLQVIKNASPDFLNYLLSRPDFLDITLDKERIKSVIKHLDIKFTTINFNEYSTDLFDFIIASKSYEINLQNIKDIYRYLLGDDFNLAEFDKSNYKFINDANFSDVLIYLNDNLNTYIENIYMKIKSNINEDYVYLIKLINSNNISDINKKLIIENSSTFILNINDIANKELIDYVFSLKKVTATWNNLFILYLMNEEFIPLHMIEYINIVDNAKTLSTVDISSTYESNSNLVRFYKKVIETDEINLDSYALILKSYKSQITGVDIDSLSYEKVSLLINESIIEINNVVFNILKDKFNDLHIRYLEINKSKLIDNTTILDLDSDDLWAILKSNVLTVQEKNTILLQVDENIIFSKTESLNLIYHLIVPDNKVSLSPPLINRLLLNNQFSLVDRIKIFNSKCDMLAKNDITKFLHTLGKPYSDIVKVGYGPVPKVPKTDYNIELVDNLERLKYISSSFSSPKSNMIRINTFRKQNNH